MTKSILIAGAGGQVGHELAIAESQHQLIALTRQQLDITDPLQIEKAFAEHKPSIVINAAAYTQVDRAEEEYAQALAINCDGVANLARICKSTNIPMFHVSTDYVFDGTKQGAYQESDPVAPLGAYGKTKELGEKALRELLDEHVILRTSWVFSTTGNNFLKTMLRLGKERREIGVVNDQFGCPTSARSIAGVLIRIGEQYFKEGGFTWGTYHYCDQPVTTWYGFAEVIFELAKDMGDYCIPKLVPLTTDEYPTLARRPANSVLGCQKLKKALCGFVAPSLWVEEVKVIIDA